MLPVARSSLGRMLLAFLPQGVTAEALAYEAKREKLDREALERELERARKSRLAYADKTVIPGPVCDRERGARLERRGGLRRRAHRPRTPSWRAPNNPAALAAARALRPALAESGAPDLKIAA